MISLIGNRRPFGICAVLALTLVGPIWAQAPATLTIGGGGDPWSDHVLRSIALDDSVRPGSLQPTQILPGQNILREPTGGLTQNNYFGWRWSDKKGKRGLAQADLLIDWNPRIWNGGGAEAAGNRTLVDGDEFTSAFKQDARTDNRPNADVWITLDLAIPVPIDSVVFFPPLIGLTADRAPRRFIDLFPVAYEVTRTNEIIDWLVFETEPDGYHALRETLGRTFANNRPTVGLDTRLAFTRFLRFKFGGVLTDMHLAEVQAFGRGFPKEARYLSVPIDLKEPVTFGAIHWAFSRYRLAPNGEIVEDPTAPVELRIRTRAGTDENPQAHFTYDERGRLIEVDREVYADLKRVQDAFDEGRAGFRGAITEDVRNWDGWSIDYPGSGEEIRSSDSRRYFQFAFELVTDDPLAFGVLDSLSFEISPLLADSAVAEVSIGGRPGLRPAELSVPLGVDTVFVYDLHVATGNVGRGFDGLDLDVPTDSELISLEMDGGQLVEGVDYRLEDSGSPEKLSLTFLGPLAETTDIRLHLRGTLFQSAVFFAGRLVDRSGTAGALPQSVEAGDVRPDVASNQLQVLAEQDRLDVLGELVLSSPVLTPNGDLRNDEVSIGVILFGVLDADLKVRIFDLAGRLVHTLEDVSSGAGRLTSRWDGVGAAGLVPPGIYVVQAEAAVDEGTFVRQTTLAVVY